MTKRMRKQKGGQSTPPPQNPPTSAEGGGEWKWVPYNPTNIGSATVMFQESADRAIKKATGGKKFQTLLFMGLIIFIITFLGITERSVFAGVPWSPVMIWGLCLCLLIFWFPTTMNAFQEMNANGKYKGILNKLWWFITSPYFFVLGLIVSIAIVAGQISGFIATKGALQVRNVLHNKMTNIWRGLWSINILNVFIFLFFMFSYPFPTEVKTSTGRIVHLYDNIHAKGIMFNLLLISLFFTAYFVVEFNTKFNVI
jgi:hypothetical protein